MVIIGRTASAMMLHSSGFQFKAAVGRSVCALVLVLLGTGVTVGCKRQSTVHHVELTSGPAESSPAQARIKSTNKVYAAWYDVPTDSLARRRARPEEWTAAHDHLPLGTQVRVTHLGNGKTAVVRITDRGLHSRRAKIDVCREAAESLGMVREGIARVKIEVLDVDSEVATTAATGAPNAH